MADWNMLGWRMKKERSAFDKYIYFQKGYSSPDGDISGQLAEDGET